MNPVWKRELRARWRGWRAFALVFLYVAVLSIGFGWQYAMSLQSQQTYEQWYGIPNAADPRQRMALMGHELFVLLAWLQIVLWMLLAPILTATAITAEREKGLLEGLHLSQLRSGEIVWGKLFSSLSLVALLILITLPITATCFLMGGVSPTEFLMVTLFHASTAICCASIGLAVSAWCRNGQAAITLSLIAVITWSGLAYASLVVALGGFGIFGRILVWPVNHLLELFVKAHPMIPVQELTVSVNNPVPWTTTTPSWAVSLIFCFVFTLFNLWVAAKGTRRLLADTRRVEWKKLRRELQTTDATNLEAPRREPSTPAPKLKRFELGFLARWQFSNPVLGREVRACFRPRSTSLAMLVLAGVLLPFGALAYLQGFYWTLYDPKMRVSIGPALLVVYLLVTIGLCTILGATGLAREREGGTWEALRLSLLSPAEIIWGKLCAPLLLCAVCGAAFLPIILACVRGWEYSPQMNNGIALSQLLGALMIGVATAWSCALLGLLVSHYSAKSVTAICWTLGTLFVVLLVAPLLFGLAGIAADQRPFVGWVMEWHPVLTMINLFERRPHLERNGAPLPPVSTLALAWPCSLALFVAGTAIYGVLLRALHARDSASNT